MGSTGISDTTPVDSPCHPEEMVHCFCWQVEGCWYPDFGNRTHAGQPRNPCKLPTRELTEHRLPASDSSPNQADKRKSGRSRIRPWQEIWHRRSPRPRSSSRPLLNSQSYTSDLRNLLEP